MEGSPEKSGMEIPDYAIKRIARCMRPMIRKSCESEEEKRELAEWKAGQKSKGKRK